MMNAKVLKKITILLKKQVSFKKNVYLIFTEKNLFIVFTIFSESHIGQNATAEEIVENLPKVWKVLMELLSHQTIAEPNISEKVTTCYKSVETKSGPVLVPSVSQTYIRLKVKLLVTSGIIQLMQIFSESWSVLVCE